METLRQNWPILTFLFGILSSGLFTLIIFVSRREAKFEANRRLFKEDGTLIYLPSDEFEKEIIKIHKEIVKNKDIIDAGCSQHRENCNKLICMKIDGVRKQLDIMDDMREDAKGDTTGILQEHTRTITSIGQSVAVMAAAVKRLEKKIDNGKGG